MLARNRSARPAPAFCFAPRWNSSPATTAQRKQRRLSWGDRLACTRAILTRCSTARNLVSPVSDALSTPATMERRAHDGSVERSRFRRGAGGRLPVRAIKNVSGWTKREPPFGSHQKRFGGCPPPPPDCEVNCEVDPAYWIRKEQKGGKPPSALPQSNPTVACYCLLLQPLIRPSENPVTVRS